MINDMMMMMTILVTLSDELLDDFASITEVGLFPMHYVSIQSTEVLHTHIIGSAWIVAKSYISTI